jgi:hypothetical protein
LKKPGCENVGEPSPFSMVKAGVIGEGVWPSMDESEEWLRISCGVGGDPTDDVAYEVV